MSFRYVIRRWIVFFTCNGGKYFSCLGWWLCTFFKDMHLAVTPAVYLSIYLSIYDHTLHYTSALYSIWKGYCSSHVIPVLSHTNNFIYYFESSSPANYDNINVYHILWQNINASFTKEIKHALYFELDFSGKTDDELVTLKVIQSRRQRKIQFRTRFLASCGGFWNNLADLFCLIIVNEALCFTLTISRNWNYINHDAELLFL